MTELWGSPSVSGLSVVQFQSGGTSARSQFRGHRRFQRREPFEDAHGQEEAGLAGDPARPIGRQAAAGHDDVDVRVMGQRPAQVWRTAVRPMRAPRCFGSAAIVVSVSAAVLK